MERLVDEFNELLKECCDREVKAQSSKGRIYLFKYVRNSAVRLRKLKLMKVGFRIALETMFFWTERSFGASVQLHGHPIIGARDLGARNIESSQTQKTWSPSP